MSTAMECETFTTPLRKLMRFFRRSRDGWKAKYQEMKRSRKLLANQVRAVERSRDRWKQLAREGQRELHQVQRELERLKSGTR